MFDINGLYYDHACKETEEFYRITIYRNGEYYDSGWEQPSHAQIHLEKLRKQYPNDDWRRSHA